MEIFLNDNFYGQIVLVDDAMLSTLKNGLCEATFYPSTLSSMR
jgi:hypothetical protein